MPRLFSLLHGATAFSLVLLGTAVFAEQGDGLPSAPAAQTNGPAGSRDEPRPDPVHRECLELGLLVAPSPGAGLFVLAVAENSPAARAGIEFGDYLRSLDGTKISRCEDLEDELRKRKPGETLMAGVWHRGADYEVSVKLQQSAAPESEYSAESRQSPAASPPLAHKSLTDGPEDTTSAKLPGTGAAWIGVALAQRDDRQGALLERIFPRGPADVAGLLPGDRVVGVGQTAVATTDDLLAVLDGAQRGASLPLTVRRGDQELQVAVTAGTRSDYLPEEDALSEGGPQAEATGSTPDASQGQPQESEPPSEQQDYDNFRRLAQHSERLEQLMWRMLDEMHTLRADVQLLKEERAAPAPANANSPNVKEETPRRPKEQTLAPRRSPGR